MRAGSNISEVLVVEGYNRYNTASPEMGIEEFNIFVAENLVKPKAAIEQNISGSVIIEFTVEPYGELSNFKVIQSLGYGCDEEAIRILKLSGKWQTFPKFRTLTTQQIFQF